MKIYISRPRGDAEETKGLFEAFRKHFANDTVVDSVAEYARLSALAADPKEEDVDEGDLIEDIYGHVSGYDALISVEGWETDVECLHERLAAMVCDIPVYDYHRGACCHPGILAERIEEREGDGRRATYRRLQKEMDYRLWQRSEELENTFSKPFAKHGLTAAAILMGERLSHIEELGRRHRLDILRDNRGLNDDVVHTLLDLANLAVLTAVEIGGWFSGHTSDMEAMSLNTSRRRRRAARGRSAAMGSEGIDGREWAARSIVNGLAPYIRHYDEQSKELSAQLANAQIDPAGYGKDRAEAASKTISALHIVLSTLATNLGILFGTNCVTSAIEEASGK